MLFFHITVVPTVIAGAGGLKLKLPLPTIVTVMVVGADVGLGLGLGIGVGVGVDRVGVGVGVVLTAVGVGFAFVGVGLGFVCVGVAPGCVDVGEGVVPVAVTPTVAVSAPADEGAFVVGALLPPHPASTIMRARMQTPPKARRRKPRRGQVVVEMVKVDIVGIRNQELGIRD